MAHELAAQATGTEAGSPAAAPPSGLTNEEASFVYNVEVLGLPFRKAADMAGLPVSTATKPHILQARELTKRELRGQVAITKEDVLCGIKDAIGRATILSEPATEIRGWEVINKMLGYDAPTRVDINVRESVQVLQQHVRTLSDVELVNIVGANDVIDVDFYELKP